MTLLLKRRCNSSKEEFLPCQVTEVRVDGAANDFTANFAEFLNPVTESYNFSWTHEGEVQGIEEEDHVLSWTASEKNVKSLNFSVIKYPTPNHSNEKLGRNNEMVNSRLKNYGTVK